jgi:hypothetical protein
MVRKKAEPVALVEVPTPLSRRDQIALQVLSVYVQSTGYPSTEQFMEVACRKSLAMADIFMKVSQE